MRLEQGENEVRLVPEVFWNLVSDLIGMAPEAFFYAVGAIALCHGKDSATVPLSE